MLGAALLAVAASLSGAATASAQSDEHPNPTLTTILNVEGTPGDGTTYSMIVECSPRYGSRFTVDGPTEKTLEITMLSGCDFSAGVTSGSHEVSRTRTCHAEGGPTCHHDPNDWADFPADENNQYLLPGNATITITLTVEPVPLETTTTEAAPAVALAPTTTAPVEESTTSSTTSSTTTSTTLTSDSELAAAQRDRGGSGGSSPWPIVLVVMAAIAATAAVTWQVRRRRGHLPNA
jgi:hypothetical protein